MTTVKGRRNQIFLFIQRESEANRSVRRIDIRQELDLGEREVYNDLNILLQRGLIGRSRPDATHSFYYVPNGRKLKNRRPKRSKQK